jgi:hypothetical protein
VTVALTSGALLGTNETTGVTIANNATSTGSEIDILGNNTSQGFSFLFLKLTSTVTAGTLDVQCYPSRVTGQAYSNIAPIIGSFAPTNGTQQIPMGTIQIARYMTAAVKNNATGASATNVFVGYTAFAAS